MKKLMFVVFLVGVFALANVATAQVTDVNQVIFTVTNALSIVGGQGLGADLAPGVSYHIQAFGGLIEPPDAGGNTDIGGSNMWTITGQPGQHISINFSLPSAFYSVTTGASFPCTYGPADGLYDAQQAADGSGAAFDPRTQYTDFIGAGGSSDVYLGFSVTVPGNIPASDDYTANFYCTVAATGL